MPLHLYNTLTRKKELFEPIDPDRVRMYVCGPTVYGDIHIGNARPLVVFDVLYRLLRHIYGADHVTYVRNITDVDDKINARAQELGEDISELTTRTAAQFHADAAALGCLPPNAEPRATDHIAEMQAMTRRLLDGGHAYVANGHVLFHVPSMPDYGRLSRRNRDELIAGARVEVAPYKRDPADFVLWKPSPPELPGWGSPWGRGRPGWHLECSAMSEKHLGTEFDIHGGGLDLIFPHHENEIAQSLCANPGTRFARYWVHNGFLQSEGEKMSKSLGNFYTVRELLAEFPGEALRFTLLQTHYRQPLDFTKHGVRQAKARLDRLYRARQKVEATESEETEVSEIDYRREDALENDPDDLNTPKAIAVLEEQASRIFAIDSVDELGALKYTYLENAGNLGLLGDDSRRWFAWRPPGGLRISSAEIEAKIQERSAARTRKDYAESDRIRDELKGEGIILEDRPDGTTEWRRA